MMNFFIIKFSILIIFFFSINTAHAQGPGQCANDPTYWDTNKYYRPGCANGSNNSANDWNCVCAADHAWLDGPMPLYSKPAVLPHWQLVYFDPFDVLDRGFWYRLAFGNATGVGGSSSSSAGLAENNTIINGTLEQKITYTPGASYPAVYAGEDPVYPPSTVSADFGTPSIMSKLAIPIDSRVQANIKVMGENHYTWPSFWLFGNNELELDIFEITDAGGDGNNPQTRETYDDPNPGAWLKATTHQTKYGYPMATNLPHQEGVAYNYGSELSLNYHLYELIWDSYKAQWWLDSNPIYTNNRFYRTYTNKRPRYYRRNWREYPVTQPSGIVIPDYNGDYEYFISQYFPSNSNYALNLLLGSGLRGDVLLDANAVSAITNTKQETDWFAFWLRSDCMSGTNQVNSLSFYNNSNSGYSQSAYETGYSIVVSPSANILLNTDAGGQKHGIFAATNDITIQGEFTVEYGSYFLAHITACQAAWDNQREMNPDSLRILDSLEIAADTIWTAEDSLITQRVLNTKFEEFNMNTSFVDIHLRYNSALVTAANEKIKGIEVLDLAGKVLYSENNMDTNEYLLSDKFLFTTGLYLIRVYGTQHVHVQKIWLQHDD